MKRVMVIGCPGGGKSTFSRALHKITGIPLHHLDMMYWNADKTIVEKSVFMERLLGAMETDEWIIDGNYGSTMEMRMQACDTIFFLDYPLEVCLEGVKARKGTVRTDMPWVEDEDDEEFIDFVKDYNVSSRPVVMELLEKYSEKDIFVFESRSEAEEYLRELSQREFRGGRKMNHDLCVKMDDGILNIRVGAIIMKEDKFLMVENDRFDHMYSVGGRIKFGETAKEAVVREVFEETGVKMEIDRLGFIHENFFPGDSEMKKGNIVHEISFFFYMKVPTDFEPVCNSFTEDGNKEHLVWIKADHSKKYYPEFFKTELANPAKEVKHYVTRNV